MPHLTIEYSANLAADIDVQALVDRLQALRREGCLIVLATHDLEVAEGLLSRVLYLRNGRVVGQDEGPRPLRERYRAAIDAS